METKTRATIEDLYKVPGKAELVDGEIVHMPPTGDEPGSCGDRIFVSLFNHAESTGEGQAVGDNKGFHVDLPNRESFCPDAAFHIGPSMGMKFHEGAPIFAVKVRSECDYGPAAERAMAKKRADYFAAGTLVVWDVDTQGPDVVRVYRSTTPNQATVYRRGDIAEAEPAVLGWRMAVDAMFRKKR